MERCLLKYCKGPWNAKFTPLVSHYTQSTEQCNYSMRRPYAYAKAVFDLGKKLTKKVVSVCYERPSELVWLWSLKS